VKKQLCATASHDASTLDLLAKLLLTCLLRTQKLGEKPKVLRSILINIFFLGLHLVSRFGKQIRKVFVMDMVLLGAVLNVQALVVTLVIGAVCGFLAGNLLKGSGMGLVPNIIVGVVGALIFGALFGSLSLVSVPFVNEIVGGTIGAVILLFAISLFKKAT